MSHHVLTRDGVVVYDFTDGTQPPIETPATPTTPTPTTPPTTGPIPDVPVLYDFGIGGGAYFPHDGRITPAGQPIRIAFTVTPGLFPQIDVFPGTGGWQSGTHISDSFPYVSDVPETYVLPNGTQMWGRGTSHDAGIPGAMYAGGRFYWEGHLDKDKDWRIQYRQTTS